MMYRGYGAGGELLMLLLMVVFVAAVVVGVVFLVRGISSGAGSTASPGAPAGERPQDIVKRRYAAGEIEREEYEQKLRDLNT